MLLLPTLLPISSRNNSSLRESESGSKQNRDSKDGNRKRAFEREIQRQREQDREGNDSNMSSITQDCLNVYIDTNICFPT